MQAGRLNEKIVIQRQEWDVSEYGSQKVEKWYDWKTTRASVDYQDGARINDNQELFFGCQVIFEIRDYHDIKNLDRILWRDNLYRILNIEIDRVVRRKIVKTELIND